VVVKGMKYHRLRRWDSKNLDPKTKTAGQDLTPKRKRRLESRPRLACRCTNCPFFQDT